MIQFSGSLSDMIDCCLTDLMHAQWAKIYKNCSKSKEKVWTHSSSKICIKYQACIESNFSTLTFIGANFFAQFSFHNKRVNEIFELMTQFIFLRFCYGNGIIEKLNLYQTLSIKFTLKNKIIDNCLLFQKTFRYDLLFII